MDTIAQFLSAISPALAAVSPIVAVVLAYSLNKYSEKRMRNQLIETELRKEKMDVLKILMTNRIFPTWQYFHALNIIDIIFADNQNVRSAWKELYQVYKNTNTDQSEQVEQIEKKQMKLIETVVDDLGYKGKITWEHISEKYNPIFMTKLVDAQRAYNNVVIKISDILDSQDSSPMVSAINKFTETMNNILRFFESLKSAQEKEIESASKEENNRHL